MMYATVYIGAGHNVIFFLLRDFTARLALGLAGSCLYQMIILYSVTEILSLCDEKCTIL